jgi:hypothetical protein
MKKMNRGLKFRVSIQKLEFLDKKGKVLLFWNFRQVGIPPDVS